MNEKFTYHIHVVVGPATSGKTEYALNLARQIGGELVNIDPRKVYRFLDIGTNKGNLQPAGSVELLKHDYPQFAYPNATKVDLLSYLTPDIRFNIYDFRTLLYALLPKITLSGKVPILTGAAGIYLSALLDPDQYQAGGHKFSPDSNQNWEEMSVAELQHLLVYTSKHIYDQMPVQFREDREHLIRHLETLEGEGKLTRHHDPLLQISAKMHYMEIAPDILEQNINTQVVNMFHNGLVEEVKAVLAKGYTPQMPGLQTVGYPQVIEYLENMERITLDTCMHNVQLAHIQNARRQTAAFASYRATHP